MYSQPCSPLILPPEIISLILEQLDFLSLIRCTEVCHEMRSLLKVGPSRLFLRYNTELVISGMQNGPPSTYSTAARLEKLIAHQDAWDHVRWSSQFHYPTSSTRLWELIGGILVLYSDEKLQFSLVQIPSYIRGIEHREWTISDLEVPLPIGDFTMDPSADLLVIVSKVSVDFQKFATTFSIHILSLETGRPHPNAQRSELVMEANAIDDEWTYDIRISDQRVAILFVPEFEESALAVWDWETGTVVKILPHCHSFAFLTNAVIMTSGISEVDHRQAELVFNDLEDEETKDYRLRLPSPEEDLDIYELRIISDSPPASSTRRQSDLLVPFTTSSEDRLFVLNYRMLDQQADDAIYAVFVPRSALLQIFRSMVSEKSFLSWNQWGPQSTRMLELEFSETWVCYVHGMKASIYDHTVKRFRLFDFSEMGLKYDLARGKKSDTEYMLQSTVIENVFEDGPVCTNLPCRVKSGGLPVNFTEAVMLTEDALVVATEPGHDKDPELIVFSF